MKLNFWQWLGVVLLILGVSYYIYGHYLREPDKTPATTPSSTLLVAPALRQVA